MGYIKKVLSDHNKTIYRMSKDTGLNVAVLYRSDSGKRSPSQNSLLKIYDYLRALNPSLELSELVNNLKVHDGRNKSKATD